MKLETALYIAGHVLALVVVVASRGRLRLHSNSVPHITITFGGSR